MRGGDTLHSVPLVLIATVLGAVLTVLAFPPFGPGILVVPGIALFLSGLLLVERPRTGFWLGFLYGNIFFAGFMWWLAELELIALVLVPVQALFFAVFAWWLVRFGARETPGRWLIMAAGGWAVMELIRYHFPVGGLEWGAAGYALSDSSATRWPAAVIGVSGLTIVVVLVAALLAQVITRRTGRGTLVGAATVVLLLGGSLAWWSMQGFEDVAHPVTVVQGSTPCPFQHCPPDERLRTYEQHLELTQSLDSAGAGLVVWPEGSTGSTNADPVLNDAVRDSIAGEAIRLGSPMVIGGDRVISDTEWINANVYFNSRGEVVGEYRKQHPVPFGEYIPWRPLFEWIPALDQVPRDMIRGDGPVLMGDVGSIISYEGGFSRYARETRQAGAEMIVVNTNTSSYGMSPASDIWIGMTRMRAVENGVPVVHAAVTGKSTVIDPTGETGPITGLGTSEVLEDSYGGSIETPYTATGDVVMCVAALAAIGLWVSSLVGWPTRSASSSMPSNSALRIDQED